MSGSTLSTTITNGITLGAGNYTSPLTITSTGSVTASTGTAALTATVANGYVLNQGSITGYSTDGSVAGNGVYLSNGTLVNNNYIAGGNNYYQSHRGYSGVTLVGAAKVINNGTIIGGSNASTYATGGSAVMGTGGAYTEYLYNNGLIAAGDSGRNAGTGVILKGNATVTNAGTISDGPGEYGRYLGNGAFGLEIGTGYVLNEAGASILGGVGQVKVENSSGKYTYGNVTVNNAGYIGGGTGVILSGDSDLINQAGGVIVDNISNVFGATYGVFVYNSGTILGEISMSGYNAVYNYAGAVIGNTAGVGVELINGSSTLMNYGTIFSSGGVSNSNAAVLIGQSNVGDGNVVVNEVGAVIEGLGSYGIGIESNRSQGTFAATVITAGTIIGTQYAVEMNSYGINDLVIDPTAVFLNGNGGAGIIRGSSYIDSSTSNARYSISNIINLAGTGPGTLAGIGTNVQNWQTLDFDAGSSWTVEGTGAGFETFTGGINGFVPGDTLDVTDFAAVSETITGHSLILTNAAGAHVTLGLTGLVDASISSDGNGGTDITVPGSVVSAPVSDGVTLSSGFLYVEATSTIAATAAGAAGVSFTNGGILETAGSISGGAGGDAVNFGSGAGTLALQAGASFYGAVVADAATDNALDLFGPNGSFALGGTVTGFQNINFDSTGVFLSGNSAELASGETINGFGIGNTFDITDFAAVSETFVNDALILTNASGGTESVTFGVPGPTTDMFNIASDGAGGTDITAPGVVTGVLSQGITLTNYAANGAGVYGDTLFISSTGYVHNASSETRDLIQSPFDPDSPVVATLINDGTIVGYNNPAGFGSQPVQLSGPGTIVNNGFILAGSTGSNLQQGAQGVQAGDGSTITNTGTIIGGAHTAEYSKAGAGLAIEQVGALTNIITNSGVIIGGSDTQTGGAGAQGIIIASRYTTIVNTGTIRGGNGSTSPQNNNLFPTSGGEGIFATYGITLTNSGVIAGGITEGGPLSGEANYAVANYSGNMRVIVDPGATFIGGIYVGQSNNVLELAGAQGHATAEFEMGGSITGFNTITFDAGESWDLSGNVSELANFQSITGFTGGDTIDLTGFAATSEVFSGGELTLTGVGGATETLNIAGAFNSIHMASDGTGGTLLEAVTCFCLGTQISTPRGQVPVEQLAIGDLVTTALGATRPVKWIGRRSYGGRFIAGNHLALPICFKAGAIAEGVPSRDLHLSPGHGVFFDGTLVPAWRLVNGVTITQAEQVDEVHYFHIELEEHDIILAENCPSETFLDLELRARFANAAEFHALYPDAVEVAALPRADSGFLLQSIQRRLAARAGIATPDAVQTGPLHGYLDRTGPDFIVGWAQNLDAPDVPVCLDIFLDGKRITRVLANEYRADLREAGIGTGCHAFTFPRAAEMAGEIEVRRSSDGAVLPLTHMASAEAGLVRAA